MANLKIGERVGLLGDQYEVDVTSGYGYFLFSLGTGDNDVIFKKLSIDKEEYIQSILGYCGNGDFPYCRSLKDLTIVVNSLQREIVKRQESRTITPQQAQSIIDIACGTWQNKLSDKWSKNIVLKTPLAVSEEFYQEMRQACTQVQHKLFDDIFGKDVLPFELSGACYIDDRLVIEKRLNSASTYNEKGFYLHPEFNWKIVEDNLGKKILSLTPATI